MQTGLQGGLAPGRPVFVCGVRRGPVGRVRAWTLLAGVALLAAGCAEPPIVRSGDPLVPSVEDLSRRLRVVQEEVEESKPRLQELRQQIAEVRGLKGDVEKLRREIQAERANRESDLKQQADRLDEIREDLRTSRQHLEETLNRLQATTRAMGQQSDAVRQDLQQQLLRRTSKVDQAVTDLEKLAADLRGTYETRLKALEERLQRAEAQAAQRAEREQELFRELREGLQGLAKAVQEDAAVQSQRLEELGQRVDELEATGAQPPATKAPAKSKPAARPKGTKR